MSASVIYHFVIHIYFYAIVKLQISTTLSLPMANTAEKLINLTHYPIASLGKDREDLVAQISTELNQYGCAVLKGFLTPEGIAASIREADKVAEHGHHSYSRTNPYFTAEDASLSVNDPRRQFYERSNAFISADNFKKQGPLRTVFDGEGFDTFIRDCLQIPENQFFRYADPLADVIVNMATEGNGFPWHFDTNNFTVTLALQNADEGGEFEYVPMLRTPENENFEEVSRVLAGTSQRVVTLNLEPGDLQLFKGRYALHRVTPLKGNTPRYVAIFSYVEEPSMVGSVERTMQLYGKTLPIHHQQASLRDDTLID